MENTLRWDENISTKLIARKLPSDEQTEGRYVGSCAEE
jgi:hypothetical protein